jgi:hypothetical protein
MVNKEITFNNRFKFKQEDVMDNKTKDIFYFLFKLHFIKIKNSLIMEL